MRPKARPRGTAAGLCPFRAQRGLSGVGRSGFAWQRAWLLWWKPEAFANLLAVMGTPIDHRRGAGSLASPGGAGTARAPREPGRGAVRRRDDGRLERGRRTRRRLREAARSLINERGFDHATLRDIAERGAYLNIDNLGFVAGYAPLEVRADNVAAIARSRGRGFGQEGVLRNPFAVDGELFDFIAMGIDL